MLMEQLASHLIWTWKRYWKRNHNRDQLQVSVFLGLTAVKMLISHIQCLRVPPCACQARIKECNWTPWLIDGWTVGVRKSKANAHVGWFISGTRRYENDTVHWLAVFITILERLTLTYSCIVYLNLKIVFLLTTLSELLEIYWLRCAWSIFKLD